MAIPKNFITKIPDLEESEIYISHVGDGEYPFNIFGDVYTDINLFLCALASHYKCTPNDFYFYYYHPNKYYIALKQYNSINYKNYYHTVGHITIERIDPVILNTGM